MKTSIAIFLMICLQVAMSPFCLCFGAEVTEEVAVESCCHAPEGVDTAPCPHCDQEMPITATAPAKGGYETDPPEWHGFDLVSSVELFDAVAPVSFDLLSGWSLLEVDPPPLPFHVVHGVFLI